MAKKNTADPEQGTGAETEQAGKTEEKKAAPPRPADPAKPYVWARQGSMSFLVGKERFAPKYGNVLMLTREELASVKRSVRACLVPQDEFGGTKRVVVKKG